MRFCFLVISGAILAPVIFFSNVVCAQESPTPPAENSDTLPGKVDWWGRSWDKQSQFILLTGVLSASTASMADHTVRDQWRDYQKMDNRTADFGDLLGTGIPGATIALMQYGWDRQHGVAHVKTLVSTTLWTGALKLVTHRKRPGDNPNYNSFPSGHTSTTFATATALTYAYGWKVGAPAYALAGLTGGSRMTDDVHWFSDVVAGAFIGVWLGRAYALNVNDEISHLDNSQNRPQNLWYPTVQNNTLILNVLSIH